MNNIWGNDGEHAQQTQGSSRLAEKKRQQWAEESSGQGGQQSHGTSGLAERKRQQWAAENKEAQSRRDNSSNSVASLSSTHREMNDDGSSRHRRGSGDQGQHSSEHMSLGDRKRQQWNSELNETQQGGHRYGEEENIGHRGNSNIPSDNTAGLSLRQRKEQQWAKERQDAPSSGTSFFDQFGSGQQQHR